MRNLLQKMTLVVALTFFMGAAMAQGFVKGTVEDADNNESLLGASVFVKGTTTGVSTGLSGTFNFEVPAGTQTIVIQFVGFTSQEFEVNVVEGQTTDLGKIALKGSAIGLNEINVLASIAIDRKTPVAVSTVKATEIENRVGARDLPNVLNITPGVYATAGGGGFGDARVNIRGFNQRNVAVMINGIPVNDMENGWVYWSNWAGLGDATETMQVQRGLGASKLAINSIGGTMNIITKTTGMEKGGSFQTSMTDYGLTKNMISLSSGQMKGGTAVQFVGSRTQGSGYIDQTYVDAWSYYLSVSQVINEKHRLAFTIVGAPQEHGQRRSELTLEQVNKYGATYNSNWGYLGGDVFNESVNKYHKPQAALNWYWNISDKSFLATSAYYSTGRGYGSGALGKYAPVNALGNYDYDAVVAWNSDGVGGYGTVYDENNNLLSESETIDRISANNHNWMGVLSTLNHTFNENLNLIAGIDLRHYKGEHYREITHLLGGDYYWERYRYAVDGVAGRDQALQVGDRIAYDNDGFNNYMGAFGQLEYDNNDFSSFLAASLSNTAYKRVDRYNYVNEADQTSDGVSFLGYNFKAGANYNITENANFFVNAGYYSKAPDFQYIWPNYTNVEGTDLANETIYAGELGYGYKANKFNMHVNAYYTVWLDKSFMATTTNVDGIQTNSLLKGLNARHMGIEFDANAQLTNDLSVGMIAALGDWRWTNDVSAIITNYQTLEQTTKNLYIENLYVGDAPQTQVGFKADYNFKKDFQFGLEVIYYDKLFADFSPESRGVATDRKDAYQLPSYTMTNFYAGYKFTFAGLNSRAGLNVYNVFDVDHWIEGTDGSAHDLNTFRGYMGFGRNFNFSLKVAF